MHTNEHEYKRKRRWRAKESPNVVSNSQRKEMRVSDRSPHYILSLVNISVHSWKILLKVLPVDFLRFFIILHLSDIQPIFLDRIVRDGQPLF